MLVGLPFLLQRLHADRLLLQVKDPANYPQFSDYQDTFSTPLPPATFAVFVVPNWVPQPTQLLRYAKVVYPYWENDVSNVAANALFPF